MAERKTKAGQAKAADEATPATGAAPETPTETTPTEAPPETPSEEEKSAAAASATSTQAAPLEPPAVRAQRTPHLGDPPTSTNPLSANAALRSVSGSDHHRLVTESGDTLSLDDLFEFPPQGSPSTLATVKQKVLEEFYYPNTTTLATHILYPAGAQVPVGEALRVIETFKHADDSEIPEAHR